MCALFGWLDYKGIVPYRVLKKLTQALVLSLSLSCIAPST